MTETRFYPEDLIQEETPTTEETPTVEETPVVEEAPVEAPVAEEAPVVEEPPVETEEPKSFVGQVLDEATTFEGNPNALTDFKELTGAAGQGLGDFIFDFAGVLGLKGADQWWDKHNPKSDDPVHTLIRDASAIIVPALYGGSVIRGVGAATKARHISTAQRTLGNILAYMGLDTSIAAISSQSYEQDNMIGAINSITGLDIPGGTKPGMSPTVRRHMHILEAAGFTLGIDLLGVLVSFGKKLKAVRSDKAAINLREREASRISKIWKNNGVDPATEFVETRKALRDDEILTETRRRIDNKNNKDYDAFINEPARVEQRAIDPDSFDVNPSLAKGDLYQIQNNIDTVDGIMRPSANPSFLDNIATSRNTTERAKALGEFFENGLSANVDVDILGEIIPAKALNEAVDKLTENLFNNQISFKQYKKIINSGKTQVFQGRKFLSNDAWVAAEQAWTKAHRELFNENNLRSSAMLTQQAADAISTTAKSLELLDGIGTSSRQWELMSKKMKFLVSEVNASREVVKRSNELKELVKANNPEQLAAWLNNQAESFDAMLNASKRKSFNIIDEIESIAKENPNWVRPLAEAYDATNGDVDSLYKLHKWTENNIGFFRKAFFDRNPEMPSKIVQGLHSIRYQSILNGLAPVRALVGNSVLSTIKPISVFAGAAAMGDVGTFKRAMYVYSGLAENIKRGFKVLGDDWRRANSNPMLSVKRGRHDIKQSTFADFEAMETTAEAWRREGKDGKVMMWNIGKSLSYWANSKINRWGITSLYSIDGFLKSLMASGNARAQAYDALFEATNGSFKRAQFEDLQRHLYDNAFHPDGTLRSAAAEFDTREIALNLDNKFVEKFELMANHVPPMKALFMFPRTGANAFELGWSFNPLSNLGPGITKAQRTLRATTPEEIAEVMMEHGRPNTVAAFKALQSEYVGRQLMGTGAVIGAGMWALEGNLTGNGPQDKAERARLRAMGWQPKSIKNPITGEWHSYEGLEPIEGLLGLVGDMVYQAERFDQSISEDWFNKVVAAITLNIGNDTLAGGLEPLVSLYSGDEGAWNRFLANQANMMLPQAGLRTILNNVWTPQLKDVENDFLTHLANKNKWAFKGDTRFLPDMLDVYTGEPIKFQEPFTAAANAILPFFKQNGGMEPWRQWLLQTDWNGLSTPRVNTITGGTPLTRWERQWINNWVGQHGALKAHVIELMNRSDDQWATQLNDYKKGLGITGQQRDTPIKKLLLHRELDRIHERAIRNGLRRLKVYYRETGGTELQQGRLRQVIEERLKRGDTEGAFDYRDQLIQINK